MNYGRLEVKIKRVCQRKRARDHLKAYLTPARKRGGAVCSPLCNSNRRISSIMAESRTVEVHLAYWPAGFDSPQVWVHWSLWENGPPPHLISELSEHLPDVFNDSVGHRVIRNQKEKWCPDRLITCLKSTLVVFFFSWQYCSDSEDLFGDYDSILGDSSVLAKLDDAEQNERLRGVEQQPEDEDVLSDSILDGLGDEPFEDLPASQLQFQEEVQEKAKRSRLQDRDKTSTPFRGLANGEGPLRRPAGARRSVADQLKRTMLGNAAAPSAVSRTVMLKEAVVSEEINVAMQAMETVSADMPDLGPFFGLPSKVKELMFKLRGIQSLYGEIFVYHNKIEIL